MPCGVDCSQFPHYVVPDADISGIGVVIGFIATAGFAVVVVVAYYLLAFDPGSNPFEQSEELPSSQQVAFIPNLYDVRSIERMRGIRNRLSKSPWATRLEDSLIKCTASMSDIQIVTGLAILISGYIQLCNGIVCCNWQLVIYLAWFSTLTHLSCLTLLRHRLQSSPLERTLRISGMAAVVVLLITALGSTGNYDFGGRPGSWQWSEWTVQPNEEEWAFIQQSWPSNSPYPSSFAVCHFYTKIHSAQSEGVISTVFSIVLVGITFISKLCKLYRLPNHALTRFITQPVKSAAARYLETMAARANARSDPLSVYRTMLYWPMLAFFIDLHCKAQLLKSLTLEVLLLVFGFVWGLVRLSIVWEMCPSLTTKWSFGQTMQVLLLAAPLFTLVELLQEGKSEQSDTATVTLATVNTTTASNATSYRIVPSPAALQHQRGSSESVHGLSSEPTVEYCDEPSLAVHHHRVYYKNTMFFNLLMTVTFCVQALTLQFTDNPLVFVLGNPERPWTWAPVIFIISGFTFSACTFLVTNLVYKGRSRPPWITLVLVVVWITLYVLQTLSFTGFESVTVLAALVVLPFIIMTSFLVVRKTWLWCRT